jgi:hypothetical protein
VPVLWLTILFAAVPAIAQTTENSTSSKKKTVATAASRRSTITPSKSVSTAARHSRNTAHEEAARGTTRVGTRRVVVTRKMVHGHWVRTTQIVHAAPGPSYQTHPDQDRYQQIQQSLASNGYFKGEANGQWGEDSVAALKQFQTDHKLVNDGKISSLSLIGLGLGPKRETAVKPVAKDAPDSIPAPMTPPVEEPSHN